MSKVWTIRECFGCGRVNSDEGVRNLLWDSETGKCYIVDWEDRTESGMYGYYWGDTHYIGWNLAEQGNGSLDDMSSWVLCFLFSPGVDSWLIDTLPPNPDTDRAYSESPTYLLAYSTNSPTTSPTGSQ